MNDGAQAGSASKRSRKRRGNQRPFDLWAPVPALPEVTAIVPATDPTALLRSLGDPPLQGRSVVAGHYLAAVTERSASLATALAAAAGLLGERADDEDDDPDDPGAGDREHEEHDEMAGHDPGDTRPAT